MVIGPNGTGKSTLVCAICIGLGWSTKHLGRAKDLDEFVKHGAKKGQIEIELAADPNRHDSNPVITTRIKKGDKANAEYLIDGKKENKKRVQELARSFSIQVDNLCQFLPQDRVVEFSRLSPVELLTETLRAAAPQQMSDWHEQLKGWRKDQKQQQAEQQGLAESIKKLEDRQKNQEGDVQRLRERKDMQDRLNALEKIRPLPEYRQAKENHGEAKRRRKEAEKELQHLEHRMQPNFAAVTRKEQYLEAIKEKTIPGRKTMVKRVERTVDDARKAMNTASERLQDCKDDIAADLNSTKGVRQAMPQLQRNVNNIKNALAKPPPEFDSAVMNEEVRELTRQMRKLTDHIDATQHDVGSLGHQISQRKQIIQQAEQERENLQSQAGQQMNKVQSFSRDAARGWEWIQSNRQRFQGEVFGPPLVECRVKDEKHASAVESMVQQSDVMAFTVTTKADFDMLTDQLYTTMKLRQVNIRTSQKDLQTYRPPVTAEELRQYGLEGWVLDLLEGPEPVLSMLCDNRNIHQTAYTFRDISQAQFEALQQSPISSWVTSKQSNIISRRKEYGDKATSTRVQDLRPARFFTKISVDRQQDSDIERKIAETQSEIDELAQSRRTKMEENEGFTSRRSALSKEKEAIEQDKKAKQSALVQYNGLTAKLELAESKVDEARQTLNSAAQRRAEKERLQDDLALEKGQHAINYANAVDSLRGKHLQQFEAEILEIEAQSDLEQLRAQHAHEEQLLNERRQERAQLERREKELLATGKRLQAECNQLSTTLTPYERDIWDELQEWNVDQLNTEVVSLTARLDSLIGGGNERTLQEFEQRAKTIELKTCKFNELGAALDELEVQIADIREQWEPQLDALVEEISDAFAENFSTIQCAGEVGVHKDEDFEHWAIQIKVKFRSVSIPQHHLRPPVADITPLTEKTRPSPSSTRTGSPAASAPSAPSSTSWRCRRSRAPPSASSTRSTRAWTRATSASCTRAWSTSRAPRPAAAARAASTSSSRPSCCRGSSTMRT